MPNLDFTPNFIHNPSRIQSILTPKHQPPRNPSRQTPKSAPASRSKQTPPPPPPAARPSKLKYLAINAFIIFHLVAILFWSIPLNTPLNAAAKTLLRPYLVSSGLFQSWDMFGPNAKSANIYLEAVVIYKDGTTSLYSFPRMEMLSYSERYAKERYRKYEETLPNDTYAALWPDAARHIARLNNDKNHANPPTKVLLVVRWSDIIMPTATRDYDRGPWDSHVFYSYDVTPEDLQ